LTIVIIVAFTSLKSCIYPNYSFS